MSPWLLNCLRWHLIFVGPQYGIRFTSPLWRLDMHPCVRNFRVWGSSLLSAFLYLVVAILYRHLPGRLNNHTVVHSLFLRSFFCILRASQALISCGGCCHLILLCCTISAAFTRTLTENTATNVIVKVVFYPIFPDLRKSIAFGSFLGLACLYCNISI
jgi:hypothetical protein